MSRQIVDVVVRLANGDTETLEGVRAPYVDPEGNLVVHNGFESWRYARRWWFGYWTESPREA